MTDRYKGLTVVLDADYRSDDAESIINAIRMVKGVASVEPSVTTAEDRMNRQRIRLELQERLAQVFEDPEAGCTCKRR